MAKMTEAAALAAIKTLRDVINDRTPTEGNWLLESPVSWGDVLEGLDKASDALEFVVRSESQGKAFIAEAMEAFPNAMIFKQAILTFFEAPGLAPGVFRFEVSEAELEMITAALEHYGEQAGHELSDRLERESNKQAGEV